MLSNFKTDFEGELLNVLTFPFGLKSVQVEKLFDLLDFAPYIEIR